MAKMLYIVDDEVFQGLPDAVQKKLLDEVKNIFSFIPGFAVEARKPKLLPAAIHFTDSVVMLVESSDATDAAARQIKRQANANLRFSIRKTGVHFTLRDVQESIDENPDKMGVGGQWKEVMTEGGGKQVSITVTFGVASLDAAKDLVVRSDLHEQTLADILRKQEKRIQELGGGLAGAARFCAKHEGLIFERDKMEAELMTKHIPLKDWPKYLADKVALVLARTVAHEARHQYINDHSQNGLGSEEMPLLGDDKGFEKFDGSDQANIVHKINQFDKDWKSAAIHLELCPQGQSSPFE